MFTGIVQEAGSVESVHKSSAGIRLAVRSQKAGAGLKIGDSVAVNGCCLTVVKLIPQLSRARAATGDRSRSERVVSFDLLHETWKRTNLQFAKVGALVNLERPLRADGRLDGHFVTGHIDGLGRVLRWEAAASDHLLEIAAGTEIMRYVILKGSVAVDGISLTVATAGKK